MHHDGHHDLECPCSIGVLQPSETTSKRKRRNSDSSFCGYSSDEPAKRAKTTTAGAAALHIPENRNMYTAGQYIVIRNPKNAERMHVAVVREVLQDVGHTKYQISITGKTWKFQKIMYEVVEYNVVCTSTVDDFKNMPTQQRRASIAYQRIAVVLVEISLKYATLDLACYQTDDGKRLYKWTGDEWH